MATCETCSNDYDKAFQIVMRGEVHTFDSFECAIHALAPTCKHCGTRIVGHGLESGGVFYRCDHCAQKDGVTKLRSRFMTNHDDRPSNRGRNETTPALLISIASMPLVVMGALWVFG
jgi:hypothetical protein